MFRRQRYRRWIAVGFMAGCVSASGFAQGAEKPIPSADFKKGSLRGKVIHAADGKPIPNATVALQAPDGKVIAWAKTDATGVYALAEDPLAALRLRPSRHKGLLARLAAGAGKVVQAPVKVAGAALGASADTAKTVVSSGVAGVAKGAVAAAATGTPLPTVASAASTVTGAATDAAKGAAQAEAGTKAQEAAKLVLGEREATPKAQRKAPVPGEVLLTVSASGFQEVKGLAGMVWLEAGRSDTPPTVGPTAWLETAKLGPTGSDRKSEIEDEAVRLSDARIEPGMAPPGTVVTIRVTLQLPPEVKPGVRVFAREDRKREVIELAAKDGGTYQGDLTLDPKLPPGPTKVAVVALRAEPVEVKLPKGKDDPLKAFVAQLDALDPDQPYEFDPRIMASENRVDLALMVLDPKTETKAQRSVTPTH